jgi:acyl phosphate:glycerol-3-phosphate acyltransferase
MLAPYIALKMVDGNPDEAWIPLVAGLLAIIGHSFTVFAGFRGGKGVLTAMGVFCTLSTVAALLSFSVWAALTFSTGFVSLGSIGGCTTLGILLTYGFFNPDSFIGPVHPGLLATGWAVAIFVIVKHKANIKRLLNGTENGFKKKKGQEKTP